MVNLQKSVLRHFAKFSFLENFVLIDRACNVSEIRFEITFAGVPATVRVVRKGGKSVGRSSRVACSTIHLRTIADSLLERLGSVFCKGRGAVLTSCGSDIPRRGLEPGDCHFNGKWPNPPGSTWRRVGSKCRVRCWCEAGTMATDLQEVGLGWGC